MSRILIVDDHEIVREGIRTLLTRARPEWEICGEAANANDAIDAVKMQKPDLVVLDITMPSVSGIDVAKKIRDLKEPSRILMFTMHDSAQLADDVRDAGAQGLVLKSQAARDLVIAIETLLAGGTFFGSPDAPQRSKKRAAKGGSSVSECAALVTDYRFCLA